MPEKFQIASKQATQANMCLDRGEHRAYRTRRGHLGEAREGYLEEATLPELCGMDKLHEKI